MSESLTSFLKATADDTRLNILGLLAQKPHSVIELAATLSLKAPTISHHISKLQKVGLVAVERQQYYTICSLEPDKLKEYVAMLTPQHLAKRSQCNQAVNAEAFEDASLARWIKNNKLTGLPTQVKEREIVLRWLAEKFEPDRRYDWDQVSDLIGQWTYWGDPHTLDITRAQRAIIDAGLLQRLPDESWHWRADSPMVQQPDFSPAQMQIANTPDLLDYTVVRATLRAKEPTGVYAKLKEPADLEVDPYRKMRKIAVRIRASKSYTQEQIDEMIVKHHGGDPDVVRSAMLAEELIVILEDGRYSRPQGRKLPK